MRLKNFLLLFVLMLTLISVLFSPGWVTAGAETDAHGRKSADSPAKEEFNWNRWRERYDRVSGENNNSSKHENKYGRFVKLPKNAVYEKQCSSCHFLYQPWLMPARSWKAIMSGPKDHFGKDLALEEGAAKEILAYLVSNSTENTRVRNRWAQKLRKHLIPVTPKSIREVPYIKRKHRKIRKEVLARASINSFSNCGACHRGAANGNYDDNDVRIPK